MILPYVGCILGPIGEYLVIAFEVVVVGEVGMNLEKIEISSACCSTKSWAEDTIQAHNQVYRTHSKAGLLEIFPSCQLACNHLDIAILDMFLLDDPSSSTQCTSRSIPAF
ncbi:hypothetical protein M0R45_027469 [Rubus argutus]|uniref:Uncharacterized protein n=1 Tax=Rubus argutus TaxID=59490 RepID=A0AAW1X1D2_RUBAR